MIEKCPPYDYIIKSCVLLTGDERLGYELSVEKSPTTANKMFLQWCRDDLVLSFIFVQRYRFVGQDAASERHHCRNTNVVRHLKSTRLANEIRK